MADSIARSEYRACSRNASRRGPTRACCVGRLAHAKTGAFALLGNNRASTRAALPQRIAGLNTSRGCVAVSDPQALPPQG